MGRLNRRYWGQDREVISLAIWKKIVTGIVSVPHRGTTDGGQKGSPAVHGAALRAPRPIRHTTVPQSAGEDGQGQKSALVTALQHHCGILKQYFRSQAAKPQHTVVVSSSKAPSRMFCAVQQRAMGHPQPIQFQVRIGPFAPFRITLDNLLPLDGQGQG